MCMRIPPLKIKILLESNPVARLVPPEAENGRMSAQRPLPFATDDERSQGSQTTSRDAGPAPNLPTKVIPTKIV